MTESPVQSHLRPYRVAAFNASKASENKIHDDAVARRFGFTGGLVPGVDVYAYMTHMPVGRWGRAWLERGAAECRLKKPVYDGDIATVTATESPAGLDLRVDSHGELCVAGHAALAAEPIAPPAAFSEATTPPLPPTRRPTRLRSRSGPGSVSSRCESPRTTPRNICAPYARRSRSTPARASSIPARSCTSAIGVKSQRDIGPMDACRQHSAAFRRRPHWR
jgi:hypothetical protein